jgi:biotin carboxylase
MKKVLFLGAATFQIDPIQYALEQGYYVITCDYLQENPGHKLAHKSFNVSTIDREGILSVAQDENIDGIITYGSDVSAPTAAYVAEKLGLPGNPLNTVEMLTNKGKFRSFLNTTGLQPLVHKCFGQNELNEIQDYLANLDLPVVIKPVDSAGSKGVSILDDLKQATADVHYAFENSFSKEILIEQYVQKMGRQVCGDGFVVDGEVVFIEFGDGHFYDDREYMAPYAESFPGTHTPAHLEKTRDKLQAILRASGFLRGAFNLDVLITESGEPFVIEIGPRSGGNFIPRAILLNTGVDTTAAAVDACLNWDYKFSAVPSRKREHFACFMVHSRESGILRNVNFSQQISKNVFECNWYLKPGEQVYPFHKANNAIGNVVFRFDSFDEMQTKMSNIIQHCDVQLDA